MSEPICSTYLINSNIGKRYVGFSDSMIDNYTFLASPDDKYPNNKPAYIYTLSDDSGVRYIGQSIELYARFYSHKYRTRNGKDKTKRGLWLKSLFENDTEPAMTVIEKCHGSISNQREQYWIDYYLKRGADLVNSNIARRG